jgi:predicted ATPase
MINAKILIFTFCLAVSSGHATDISSFTTLADNFFKKYVSNGQIAYSKIKQNNTEIEELYKQIADIHLNGLDNNSKKAFYINSYNLIAIYEVTKHYPLKSPMDVKGFFDNVLHTVAGEKMTLNDLEIKKLLQPYKDARFHFALVCAARSCPLLPSFAFQAEGLDQQLTERAKLALNNKEWVKVYPNQKKAELSKIFEWYRADFTTEGKTSVDWINQFRKEKIPNNFAVGYYEYDWALNER